MPDPPDGNSVRFRPHGDDLCVRLDVPSHNSVCLRLCLTPYDDVSFGFEQKRCWCRVTDRDGASYRYMVRVTCPISNTRRPPEPHSVRVDFVSSHSIRHAVGVGVHFASSAR